MPTGRFGLAVAVLYNPLHQPTLYAVGGIDADGGLLATVEAYDFATNSWNTKAPFPSYGIAPLATVLQSTIYLAVGNAFFVYDLVADSWRLKAYAPPGLGFGSFGQIGAINGQIYVLEAGNRSFTVLTRRKIPGRYFQNARSPIVMERQRLSAGNSMWRGGIQPQTM